MTPVSPNSHPSCFAIIALLLCIVLFGSIPLHGQSHRDWIDTTLPEEKKPYGLEADDFPIGIYALNYNHSRPIEELWSYMSDMGMNLVEVFVEEKNNLNLPQNETFWERYRKLLTSSLRPPDGKVVPSISYKASVLAQSGQAQEIIFYPFDSSQIEQTDYYAPYAFEHIMTERNDVLTEFNQRLEYRVGDNGPRESIYELSDSGETVMEGICYDWRPERIHRFTPYYDSSSSSWKEWYKTTVMDASSLLRENFEKRAPISEYYVMVKGHLFDSGTAANSDSLLRIDVYYEVPYGKKYFDASDVQQTASTNERFLYTTLWVKKSDLFPANILEPEWDEYREVAIPINFYECTECHMRGPLYPGNESLQFDMEVVYLGKEKLALRSVALRDSIVHLLIREDQPGQDFRQAVVDEVDSLVNSNSDGTGSLLPQIFAVTPAGEPLGTKYAGFREIDRLLRQHYQNSAGDSLKAWTEIGIPYVHHEGEADWVVPEIYFNVAGNTPDDQYNYKTKYEIDHHQIPSIKQHNGGRWNIPELFDLDSIGIGTYNNAMPDKIASYEQTLQTLLFGRYSPLDIDDWPQNATRIMELARYAKTARANGRRMLAIMGPNSFFNIGPADPVTGDRDTIVTHRGEPAELRAFTNLAVFGYGAKGISYFDRSLPPWLRPRSGGWLRSDVIGFGGEYVGDTARNIFDFAFRAPGTQDTITLVNDYYLGLRSTHEEMRAINTRLNIMSPVLTGLRWRDAYSVHWGVRRPGKDAGQTPRPLPSNEIVTEVTAWHPITGLEDADWETYIELGLYETNIGMADTVRDYLKDTNYVAVVNRRSFETLKPYDITYSSATKALMDTLSETRTISLKFNLPHPDSTQYSFIRVREVLPDTASLPLIGSRSPLDTIIHGVDSSVVITLGAGRAALLEITYEPGDHSIVDGRLAWNNQRKMVHFSDDRWHSVYLRNDSVLYRRSMKAGPEMGSILWEPVETLVSTDTIAIRTRNWFPSLTMRKQSGQTIATVVWSCHSHDPVAAFAGARDVVVRDINLSQGTLSNIWFVDFHHGTDSSQWGDVVVSALDGADIIAWGDSQAGILARARKLGGFGSPPVFSGVDSVSWPFHMCGKVGRWPTVPTFGHIASADSNCGIAWNQRQCFVNSSQINYARLEHVDAGGGVPGIVKRNMMTASAYPGDLGRPSIDQTQDVYERVQEGLGWVEDINGSSPSKIWFRSLYTPTTNRPLWDSIEMTQG